jgi:hypothetical protein
VQNQGCSCFPNNLQDVVCHIFVAVVRIPVRHDCQIVSSHKINTTLTLVIYSTFSVSSRALSMDQIIGIQRPLLALVPSQATRSPADFRTINILENCNPTGFHCGLQMTHITRTQQYHKLPALNVSLTFELSKNSLSRYNMTVFCHLKMTLRYASTSSYAHSKDA